MNYARQYVRSAEQICSLYDGSLPLAAFLKQYFAQHKKFGSRDRKRISHLCYCYYRIGRAVTDLAFEERIRIALFLCQHTPAEWQELFEEEWIGQWHSSLEDRVHFVLQKFPAFSVTGIFAWQHRLNTDTYDAVAFSLSHLVQPDLFLRLRPGNAEVVKQKLTAAHLFFENINEQCIALPNGTKVDDVLNIDREVVVQDHSSQRIAELLVAIDSKEYLQVWDCCAASGGKSILVQDIFSSVTLVVSDIRLSIIQNLRKRFDRAGIHTKHVFVADLSQPLSKNSVKDFDLVICDVPCTGSGTWGRTPEQLYFFSEEKIDVYAELQRKIVSHVLPHVKPGGYLLYSTCSVFSKENEDILTVLPAGIEVVKMEWLKGYDRKADSMFAVLLRRTTE